MNTSMPASTSKNKDGCRCNKDCGCCANRAQTKELGFFAKRPWIWVCVAFGVMFSAWTVMFSFAINNQPQVVPMAVNAAE